MDVRSFGKDSFKVAEIGLGAWQLGGDWGDVDDATAEATLEAAVASGVNFIDTADVYGGGKSEQRIGAFLKKHADRSIFVATKLGRRGDPGWPHNFERAGVRAHTEDSLRRLGVEALDLTQLHCVPTNVLQAGTIFDHLRELQQEGKIRRWGASVESMEQADICLAQPGLASLQIIFNIFRQKPIDSLFATAKDKGVALIIRLPLASGLLSGRMNAQTTFDASDHRRYNRDGQAFNVGETFAGLPFAKGVELADTLKGHVPAGLPMARFALRWILDHEAVSVIIPGARSPMQVRDNVAASETPPLSAEVHTRLREFYRSQVHAHIRGPY